MEENAAIIDVIRSRFTEFVEMFSEYIFRLKEWVESDNRWMRRGTEETQIIPARKVKLSR
ncbi:DNA alkylation repair protein [uncultured Bacteroides sp.]|uniref:DNA alkylation repair protein n=1 Tax=uncultured Bacteroides sp. TaxID=162156 RepID=UPI0025E01F75|nr:DNA alkylation repair protein [uncultured Bacteroides sp.]